MNYSISKALPIALLFTALTVDGRTAHAQSCADSSSCNGAVGDANSAYSGLWATRSYNNGNGYMALTDGGTLFLNAPNVTSSGGILFRLGNNGELPDWIGGHSAMILDASGNLSVQGNFTAYSTGGTTIIPAITGIDQTNVTGGVGVRGETTSGMAIYGVAQGGTTQAPGYGVYGQAMQRNGIGVYGSSQQDGGSGVSGVASTSSFGVYGSSVSFTGVYGISTSGIGVEGFTSSTTQAAVYANSPSANGLAFYGNGKITVTGSTATKQTAGSWVGTSDIRTKKNVVAYTPGLDEIERINPIRYHYNGLGGTVDDGEHVGVSAQELEKIAPEMVSTVQKKLNASDLTTTAIKQVDPSDLTYMLINSVKELNAEVKNLRQEVSNLKKGK